MLLGAEWLQQGRSLLFDAQQSHYGGMDSGQSWLFCIMNPLCCPALFITRLSTSQDVWVYSETLTPKQGQASDQPKGAGIGAMHLSEPVLTICVPSAGRCLCGWGWGRCIWDWGWR